MLINENQLLINRFVAVFNTGEVHELDEIVDADIVQHIPDADGKGITRLKQYIIALRVAFPDYHNEISLQLAAGDWVATQNILRGTHSSEFQGIPATEKTITLQTFNVFRIENQHIVEHWETFNNSDLLRQLEHPGDN